MRELFRKIDFFILFLIGLALSFWAFLEKEFFGCLILFLSSIVFSVSRWRWIYKKQKHSLMSMREKNEAKEWFKKRVLWHFRWRTYLFIYLLTIPFLFVANNSLELGFQDHHIVFGAILFYIILSSIMLIFKLKNNH